MEQTERYHSLDFLRAMAMYLGVILHVTILFGSPDRIIFLFYSEYHSDPVNYHVTWGVHLFRMQFFYLIAGFFAEINQDCASLEDRNRVAVRPVRVDDGGDPVIG